MPSKVHTQANAYRRLWALVLLEYGNPETRKFQGWAADHPQLAGRLRPRVLNLHSFQ